jgi:hypothetical protein
VFTDDCCGLRVPSEVEQSLDDFAIIQLRQHLWYKYEHSDSDKLFSLPYALLLLCDDHKNPSVSAQRKSEKRSTTKQT